MALNLLQGEVYVVPASSLPWQLEADLPSGVLVFDGFGLVLEPATVRIRLRTYRDIAASRELILVLVTTNHAALDAMPPDHVIVRDPCDLQFKILSGVRDPEWLAHFSLGDLYDQGEFTGRV